MSGTLDPLAGQDLHPARPVECVLCCTSGLLVQHSVGSKVMGIRSGMAMLLYVRFTRSNRSVIIILDSVWR
jgi:hypothetical protein